MKILFCHVNYPAQFKRLAPSLSSDGHEIAFLYKNREWNAQKFNHLICSQYSVSRLSASEDGILHPYLGRFEDAVLEGQLD